MPNSLMSKIKDGTIILSGDVGEIVGKLIEVERQTLISEFLEDMIFDGECYKMSIKNHEKWGKL